MLHLATWMLGTLKQNHNEQANERIHIEAIALGR